MIVKDKEELSILREGGKRLKMILNALKNNVAPGVSAFDLNKLASKIITEMEDRPSFLNYKPAGALEPYPFSICVSVNDEVVHGLPNKEKIFKEGDIVGIDVGLIHKGLFTDSAITVPVGKISKNDWHLINTTKEALEAGIKEAKVGGFTGDIGFAVEQVAKKNGFSVVKDLAGHGVGRAVHEDPFVPNYGKRGKGDKLPAGIVIAIEPMLNAGSDKVVLDERSGAYITADGKKSCHFEHTVVILSDKVEVITD